MQKKIKRKQKKQAMRWNKKKLKQLRHVAKQPPQEKITKQTVTQTPKNQTNSKQTNSKPLLKSIVKALTMQNDNLNSFSI